MQEEIKKLREEIEELNTSIRYVQHLYTSTVSVAPKLMNYLFFLLYFSACQEQLPATGVPMRQNRLDHMEERFNDYVQRHTFQNWKFWIVSSNKTPRMFYAVQNPYIFLYHVNPPIERDRSVFCQ